VYKCILGIFFCLLCVNSFDARGSVIGPLEYQGFADSPFQGLAFDYFYLETFEDRLFNVPGVTAIGSIPPIIATPENNFPGTVDSVEYGSNGITLFGEWGPSGITFEFDIQVLGQLPTHVGIVWTDGRNSIRFDAFDSNGSLIGSIAGNHADGTFFSSSAEDRFYGITDLDGISKFHISSGSGVGIEVDHLQYGFWSSQPVPEPTSMAIFGLSALGLAYRSRRKGKA
jgi:hypothetical protein